MARYRGISAFDMTTDVVCAGILVADIFSSPIDSLPPAGGLKLMEKYVLSAGGCATNTAAVLRRLGRKVKVVGKVGNDLFGDFVLRDLERLGIGASAIARSQSHPTSCTFIINVPGQDRRYIHCLGANSDFSLVDIDTATSDGARILYVGGYLAMPAFRPDHLVQLFREAKKCGLITALDVVIPAGYAVSIKDIQDVLPYTDVFLPNRDEARALTGQNDPMDQANVLARLNPKCTVVITQGKAGTLVRREDQVMHAGVYQVDSVDESGAGDAFSAGFLVGVLENWSLEDSLRFASAEGASCTRALGCRDGVFRFDEAIAFVAKNPLKLKKIH